MEKVKVLSSLEEIRVFSDPFRFKIVLAFAEDRLSMTVKQIAVKLGEVPAKVHYHVKELERIGVLEIVETKEKAGIIEKYYLPTAESFSLEKSIGNTAWQEEQLLVGSNIFRSMQQDFESSQRMKDNDDNDSMLSYGVYHLTDDEREQLKKMVLDFLSDKEQREGRKPYAFGVALFRKYKAGEVNKDGN